MFSLLLQSIVQSLCDPTVSLMPFETPFTDQHVSCFSFYVSLKPSLSSSLAFVVGGIRMRECVLVAKPPRSPTFKPPGKKFNSTLPNSSRGFTTRAEITKEPLE